MPFFVNTIYQLFFLFSRPSLDLLFPFNGTDAIPKCLVINKFDDIVFLCEPFYKFLLMLIHPSSNSSSLCKEQYLLCWSLCKHKTVLLPSTHHINTTNEIATACKAGLAMTNYFGTSFFSGSVSTLNPSGILNSKTFLSIFSFTFGWRNFIS